jgi:hypothetical protein
LFSLWRPFDLVGLQHPLGYCLKRDFGSSNEIVVLIGFFAEEPGSKEVPSYLMNNSMTQLDFGSRKSAAAAIGNCSLNEMRLLIGSY